MSSFIYHITSRSAWSAAQQTGEYVTDSLASEGFIHCSKANQVLRVANAFYRGETGLVLLEIDLTRVLPEVRWEPGTDRPGELFPHIYGPLDPQAVARRLDFPPAAGGQFTSLPI